MELPHEVLVVDDDPDLVEVIAQLLDDAGFEVKTAANGVEALAQVERHRPGVVVLDMLMPVMDGWRCARELKAKYGNLPVVVVTAAEHAGQRAAEVDADAVLAKPFDFDALMRTIGRWVAPVNGKAAAVE